MHIDHRLDVCETHFSRGLLTCSDGNRGLLASLGDVTKPSMFFDCIYRDPLQIILRERCSQSRHRAQDRFVSEGTITNF